MLEFLAGLSSGPAFWLASVSLIAWPDNSNGFPLAYSGWRVRKMKTTTKMMTTNERKEAEELAQQLLFALDGGLLVSMKDKSGRFCRQIEATGKRGVIISFELDCLVRRGGWVVRCEDGSFRVHEGLRAIDASMCPISSTAAKTAMSLARKLAMGWNAVLMAAPGGCGMAVFANGKLQSRVSR